MQIKTKHTYVAALVFGMALVMVNAINLDFSQPVANIILSRETLGLATGVLFLIFARRFASFYQVPKTSQELIKRDGDKLVIKRDLLQPKLVLPIAKLGTLSYRDNYLSIILGDNGNGYDLFMQDSGENILSTIQSLLSEEELKKVKLLALS